MDADDADDGSFFYVYCSEGLFAVPSRHIVQDCEAFGNHAAYFTNDIEIRNETRLFWKSYRRSGFMSASRIFDPKRGLWIHLDVWLAHLSMIRTGTADNEKRLWCARVQLDHNEFGVPDDALQWNHCFGERFLWILDSHEVQTFLQNADLLIDYDHAEVRTLRANMPTAHAFDYRDWPGSVPLESVSCFYARMFLASVRPLRIKTEPSPDLARDVNQQPTPGTAGWFRPETCPDEVFLHFLGRYARELLSSERPHDVLAFHRLRLVSRTFRDEADHQVALFFLEITKKMELAHRTERVEDLFAARDLAHRLNVTPIELASARVSTPFRVWNTLRGAGRV